MKSLRLPNLLDQSALAYDPGSLTYNGFPNWIIFLTNGSQLDLFKQSSLARISASAPPRGCPPKPAACLLAGTGSCWTSALGCIHLCSFAPVIFLMSHNLALINSLKARLGLDCMYSVSSSRPTVIICVRVSLALSQSSPVLISKRA